MKKFNRRILRERALQVLYAYEMQNDDLQRLITESLAELDECMDKEFCVQLIKKVISIKDEIDENIKERVNNWEMKRIALIDKILLRIGITELLYFPDIPPKVSINEVIEIAKNYSTSNSGKFINGILDAILTDLKKSGKLKKTGRGLIEETLPKSSSQK
ncbi:MAG: transcription antitermination factor NusB [Ignavibacteria bacterium RBG_13_36_8]|nr:MAG: transcription antitermination factor NusB [Ignavibacteria bacterium RBG_13_36_8]